MNSETKTPKTGQFWFKDGVRVLVREPTHTGRSVVETMDGWTNHNWDFTGWHHEPRCDSFDWVKPPEPVNVLSNCPDCGEFRGHGHECKPPEPVVESPDDWVEITESHTGHIRRKCDQVCGKTVDPNYWHWVNHTVGYSQNVYPNSRIRCRRKNLPVPMTLQSVAEVCTTEPGPSPVPAVKRVPVRLWIDSDTSDVYAGNMQSIRDMLIKHDSDGFYIEQ